MKNKAKSESNGTVQGVDVRLRNCWSFYLRGLSLVELNPPNISNIVTWEWSVEDDSALFLTLALGRDRIGPSFWSDPFNLLPLVLIGSISLVVVSFVAHRARPSPKHYGTSTGCGWVRSLQ